MSRKSRASRAAVAATVPAGPLFDVWEAGVATRGLTLSEVAKALMEDEVNVEFAMEMQGRCDVGTLIAVPAGAPEPSPLVLPEEKVRRSVVGEQYKARYRANGNHRGCGDWLHTTLDALTTGSDGKLDVARFEAICDENGVDLAKYNRTSNGWQGRLRMTGRILLRSRILKHPDFALIADGEKHIADPAWVTKNQG